MINTYTALYRSIASGYMGQLAEWPEVVTEGTTLEECREMLEDVLREMIAAYRQENTEIPLRRDSTGVDPNRDIEGPWLISFQSNLR